MTTTRPTTVTITLANKRIHSVSADGVTLRSLMAIGISGGIVPCPEALGIMVIAVGLNRIVFGAGLIVSFSLGIAAVLDTD